MELQITRADKRRYIENWNDERNSAFLYRALAEQEADPRLVDVYRRLAITEEKHAATWAQRLQDAGETLPMFTPSWRSRT